MKILMYGWEFPPHISGGLGVACHAIVTELAKKNIEIALILPQTVPTIVPNVTITGCDALTDNEFFIPRNQVGRENIATIYPEILTSLQPYFSGAANKEILGNISLQEYFALLTAMHLPNELQAVAIAAAEKTGAEKFTGQYSLNLFAEVFRYALLAGGLARNYSHDVIHAHDWLTALAGVEAKRISNKPLVLHIHALETDRSGIWLNPNIFAIEKYAMQQADRIVAVSQYTKDAIQHHYGIAAEKIAVVHNGIYLNEQPTGKIKNPEQPKMILFLGRLTQQKGPYYFVEIAKQILQQKQNVQFVLAGTGDQLGNLIEHTAELRIGKNVHFTGFLNRDQVQEIYRLADVYVMPSVSEPFGIAALEALANDVPVVLAKQAGVTEVLHHCLVADFWDVDAMAAKILALLTYPALYRASLENSRQDLAVQTWDRAADKLIEIYKNLL